MRTGTRGHASRRTRSAAAARGVVGAAARRQAVTRALHAVLWAAIVAGCTYDPGHGGRSSGHWAAQLATDTTADARADAAVALGRVLELQPDQPVAVAALIRALADTSDPVRASAARALTGAARAGRRIRAMLPGAVPKLAALLADSAHPSVRADAAGVLGALGTTAGPDGIRALAAALRDPSASVRGAALAGVAAVGPPMRASAPDIDTVLARLSAQDSYAGNRRAAVAAIGALGVPAAAAIPALAAATTDPDAGVRAAAVTTLGGLDAATASAARRALTRALADRDSLVRQEAAHALSAWHRRGGEDPAPPEPSRVELCSRSPRQVGC